MNEKKR